MGSYEKGEEFMEEPKEEAPATLASRAGSSESSRRLVMVVSTQLVFTATEGRYSVAVIIVLNVILSIYFCIVQLHIVVACIGRYLLYFLEVALD